MSSRPANQSRAWFYLIILLPFLLYAALSHLLSVQHYSYKIDRYFDLTENSQAKLPFRDIDTGLNTVIVGHFAVANDPLSPVSHLYFPNFEGSMRVSIDGVVIFDNLDIPSRISANRMTDLLIALPERTFDNSQQTVKAHFEIGATDTLFVGLSEGYAGRIEDFQSIVSLKSFLYELVRPSLAALLIIGSLFLAVLMGSGVFKVEFLGLIAVFAVIVIVTAISLIPASQGSKYLLFKTLLFTPTAVALSAYLIENSLTSYHQRRMLWLALLFSVISGIAIAIAPVVEVHEGSFILFYSVPATIICSLLLGLYYSVVAFRNRTLVAFTLSMSLLSFALSVIHDTLTKVGLIHADFLSVSLTIMALCLSLTIALALGAAESINQLRSNQRNLTLSLDQQSKLLEQQFAERQQLLDRQLNAQHRASLLTDLHDGVLNYLSSIYAMSEGSRNGEVGHINKLAKHAMNEIRVILDTDVDHSTGSLLVTCSVLREQVTQTLAYMGCTANWELAALEHYPSPTNQTNLEVFRILQEALHNATARAGATAVTVTAKQQRQGLYTLTVVNSGGQTLAAATRQGHGVNNMHARAKRIKGQLSLISQPGGACLTLTLP